MSVRVIAVWRAVLSSFYPTIFIVPRNFLNLIIMITPHFFIIIVLVTIVDTLSMLMAFAIFFLGELLQ